MRIMALRRFAVAATLLAFATLHAPLRAQEAVRPAHAEAGYSCLDQKQRRAEMETGKLVRLFSAIRAARSRMPGTVIRAWLCQGPDGLVYVLTVLARDGKVARLTVDAVKGTLVGER
jgi:uncharacterized membrane protein YkoI